MRDTISYLFKRHDVRALIFGVVPLLAGISLVVLAGRMGDSPPAIITPSGTSRDSARLFFILPDDGGRRGALVACGDSLVGYTPLAESGTGALTLRQSLNALFRTPARPSVLPGAYNALGHSSLRVDGIVVSAGVADISLVGSFRPDTACEGARAEALTMSIRSTRNGCANLLLRRIVFLAAPVVVVSLLAASSRSFAAESSPLAYPVPIYRVASVGYGVSMTMADFNGDDMDDVAISHSYPRIVSIVLGTDDGGFRAATEISMPGDPHALASADFNSDGYPDIAVAVSTNDSVCPIG